MAKKKNSGSNFFFTREDFEILGKNPYARRRSGLKDTSAKKKNKKNNKDRGDSL